MNTNELSKASQDGELDYTLNLHFWSYEAAYLLSCFFGFFGIGLPLSR